MENQFDDAITSFEKGLELDPNNIYGLSKLARAYKKRNTKDDLQNANEIVENLEKIAPEHIRLKWLKNDFSKK